MKLVLSRKGFDAANGGRASPIFPDGQMYSLPIKGKGEPKSFGEIRKGSVEDGTDLATVLEDLTAGRLGRADGAHFDPDLDGGAMARRPGWRPCFGQSGAAQGHLRGQGVGVGDVFVFYGWFRRVARNARRQWAGAPGAADLHVVFGWLQIGAVFDVGRVGSARLVRQNPWLRDHPHVHFDPHEVRGDNVIYAASDRLVLPGIGDTGLAGGGEVKRFDASRVLTGGGRRSEWSVPAWFMGGAHRPWLTLHDDPTRWRRSGGRVMLKTTSPGQEFVLDCERRPEAASWLHHLLGG